MRAVDYLERDGRVQNRVSRAVSDRHRSCAELDRKTIVAHFDFEMRIPQRPGRASLATGRTCGRRFVVRTDCETNQTTKAFAVWPAMRQGSTARGTDSHCRFGKKSLLVHSGACEITRSGFGESAFAGRA